jgi:hypothetical protein
MTEPLITIRPGPVLHVWRGGKETEAVPLSQDQIVYLICALAGALWQNNGDPVPNGTPMEHERG